jgi:hypothetical protein
MKYLKKHRDEAGSTCEVVPCPLRDGGKTRRGGALRRGAGQMSVADGGLLPTRGGSHAVAKVAAGDHWL